MVAISSNAKPHAVCVPHPTQGHINPMLQLAKLLHHRGFYITFVNTEYNQRRLLKSKGPNALDILPDFRFETIPDGLPPTDADSTQDIPSLCVSTSKNCLTPICNLISRLNNAAPVVPPVTCMISDGVMSFTIKAAEKLGIPIVLFWTSSACGLLGYAQYKHLVQRGYIPLKDTSDVKSGYLETTLDWIPGMKDMIRLRDLPTFIRTTDPDDIMLNFLINEVENIPEASAIVLNTFDALEHHALNALRDVYPSVYSIGSLQLMLNQIEDERLKSMRSNLWKEEMGCIDWLNSKEPNSVLYVNFGSITKMSVQQLNEFAWGLANSKKSFLWIIRPDIVAGETATLPPEFATETKERGRLASWCPQEQVLKHPAIGGFLTHSGWNSILESICSGVPVICWPFFAEQQTNCRFSCVEWDIGMEIDNDVKRDEVEKLVRELMEGEKGKRKKKNAMEWKNKAEGAVASGGSSIIYFDKLVKEVLFAKLI